MNSPVAYLNGQWIDARDAKVSVHDNGFIQGTTVAERLRTFAGKLFHLEQHLDRLARSLKIIGVAPSQSMVDLGEIAHEIAARNHRLLAHGDDLGLTLFVTPGVEGVPTVCLHTEPLPFHTWVEKYRQGDALVVPTVKQVPAECWPPELKCRSRMHYFLADREARIKDPGSRAIMVDGDGYVTEASTANMLLYREGEGLISPPREAILPGVTVAAIADMAATLGIPFVNRPIPLNDLESADEVLLCSTSPVVWTVTRLNGHPLKPGVPGPITRRLQRAWSDAVGIDLVGQAERFRRR